MGWGDALLAPFEAIGRVRQSYFNPMWRTEQKNREEQLKLTQEARKQSAMTAELKAIEMMSPEEQPAALVRTMNKYNPEGKWTPEQFKQLLSRPEMERAARIKNKLEPTPATPEETARIGKMVFEGAREGSIPEKAVSWWDKMFNLNLPQENRTQTITPDLQNALGLPTNQADVPRYVLPEPKQTLEQLKVREIQKAPASPEASYLIGTANPPQAEPWELKYMTAEELKGKAIGKKYQQGGIILKENKTSPIGYDQIRQTFDPDTKKYFEENMGSATPTQVKANVAPEALQTSTKAKVEQDILELDLNIQAMNNMEKQTENEFLQYTGQGKAAVGKIFSKAGIPETEANKDFRGRFEAWKSDTVRQFLNYRKTMTGTAGGEKEMEQIESVVAMPADDPVSYRAKLTAAEKTLWQARNKMEMFRRNGIINPTKEQLATVDFTKLPDKPLPKLMNAGNAPTAEKPSIREVQGNKDVNLEKLKKLVKIKKLDPQSQKEIEDIIQNAISDEVQQALKILGD